MTARKRLSTQGRGAAPGMPRGADTQRTRRHITVRLAAGTPRKCRSMGQARTRLADARHKACIGRSASSRVWMAREARCAGPRGRNPVTTTLASSAAPPSRSLRRHTQLSYCNTGRPFTLTKVWAGICASVWMIPVAIEKELDNVIKEVV
jgi:hypothetical protein